ncbi:MAG: tripartite tricarboxylate transporter substrate binding protein [Clostridia bacterium]
MNKKLVAILGIFVLVFSMLFAGCGAKETPNTATPEQKTQAPKPEEKKEEPKAEIKWPTKPIQILVPASAGGGTDISARLVGAAIEKEFGQPVVIVNMNGGGGSVASRQVKDSAPDGYTFIWWHNGMLVNKLMNIVDYSYESFEVGPVVVADNSNGLFVNSKGKYKDFTSFVEAAKANPGKLTYATEFGSFTHLQGVALCDALDIKLNIADIGSDSVKRTALLGAQIDTSPGLYGTFKPQVDSGDFGYIAALSENKPSFIPKDVKSVKELGYDFSFDGYNFGLFAPKGTSKEIMNKISDALEKATKDQAFADEMGKKYMAIAFKNPEAATKYWGDLTAQYEKYKDQMLSSKK